VSDRALFGCVWDTGLLWEYRISQHLHSGLELYLKEGIRPGGFLYAVLTNDLRNAVNRAASFSAIDSMSRIVMFLQTEAPEVVWGSVANVEAWIAECAKSRSTSKEPDAQIL
jgi:hypothetical protein